MKKKKKCPRERIPSDVNTQHTDFAEISLPDEAFDLTLQKYANFQVQEKFFDERDTALNERQEAYERKQDLLKEVYQIASDILTDAQFRIFTLRYIYNLKEVEIAKHIDRRQPYVAIVLRACIKKIKQKVLLSRSSA